jgi:hypothetical protein
VGRRLSSARFRRRLIWVGAIAVVGAAVTGLVLAFPAPKPGPNAHPSKHSVIFHQAQSKSVSFAPKRKQVVRTAMKFVETAVARHNIGRSWDLVTPAMKAGHTRADWAKGNDLPVPMYPAKLAIWHLAYSNSDEIDVQVGLFASSKQIRPTVFDVTLHPVREHRQTRWLVDSFLPTPSDGGGLGSNPIANLLNPNNPRTQQIGKVWLFVPLGIFAILPAVLLGLGIRRWRSARVYRAYARGE